MKCTKCGRDTKSNAVFCSKCLEVMARYPIKPGTVVQLPSRKPVPSKKATPRRKTLPPEELVVRQRKTIKWLWVVLSVTFLLLCLSVSLLLHREQQAEAVSTIGQNYVTKEAGGG